MARRRWCWCDVGFYLLLFGWLALPSIVVPLVSFFPRVFAASEAFCAKIELSTSFSYPAAVSERVGRTPFRPGTSDWIVRLIASPSLIPAGEQSGLSSRSRFQHRAGVSSIMHGHSSLITKALLAASRNLSDSCALYSSFVHVTADSGHMETSLVGQVRPQQLVLERQIFSRSRRVVNICGVAVPVHGHWLDVPVAQQSRFLQSNSADNSWSSGLRIAASRQIQDARLQPSSCAQGSGSSRQFETGRTLSRGHLVCGTQGFLSDERQVAACWWTHYFVDTIFISSWYYFSVLVFAIPSRHFVTVTGHALTPTEVASAFSPDLSLGLTWLCLLCGQHTGAHYSPYQDWPSSVPR